MATNGFGTRPLSNDDAPLNIDGPEYDYVERLQAPGKAEEIADHRKYPSDNPYSGGGGLGPPWALQRQVLQSMMGATSNQKMVAPEIRTPRLPDIAPINPPKATLEEMAQGPGFGDKVRHALEWDQPTITPGGFVDRTLVDRPGSGSFADRAVPAGSVMSARSAPQEQPSEDRPNSPPTARADAGGPSGALAKTAMGATLPQRKMDVGYAAKGAPARGFDSLAEYAPKLDPMVADYVRSKQQDGASGNQALPGGHSDKGQTGNADEDTLADAQWRSSLRSAASSLTGKDTDSEAPIRDYMARKAASDSAGQKDPGSKASQSARAIVGGLMPELRKQMGPAFDQMTAADLNGPMEKWAQFSTAARTKAEDAKAQIASREQLARDALQSKSEQGDLNRENRLSTAQLMASMRGGANSDRASARLDKQVEGVGKDLEQFASTKDDIDILMGAAQKKDVPGVGVIDSRLPGFMQSAEDADVIQAKERMKANIIQYQKRFRSSPGMIHTEIAKYGLQEGATEQQFREGMKRLARDAPHMAQQMESRHPREAVAEFRARGGQTSQDFGDRGQSPGGADSAQGEMVQIIAPNGQPGTVLKSKLKAALAKGARLP